MSCRHSASWGRGCQGRLEASRRLINAIKLWRSRQLMVCPDLIQSKPERRGAVCWSVEASVGGGAPALAPALQLHPSERSSFLSQLHTIKLPIRVPYFKAVVRLSSLTARLLEVEGPSGTSCLWFVHAFASKLRATVASTCRYECAFAVYRSFITRFLHTIFVTTFRSGSSVCCA